MRHLFVDTFYLIALASTGSVARTGFDVQSVSS
jgi:hypothetical protein